MIDGETWEKLEGGIPALIHEGVAAERWASAETSVNIQLGLLEADLRETGWLDAVKTLHQLTGTVTGSVTAEEHALRGHTFDQLIGEIIQ